PLTGIFVIAAWSAWDLRARWSPRSLMVETAFVAVVLACAISARMQVRYWSDSVTLWTHAVEVAPENPGALHNLGLALAGESRFSEAAARYREALRIQPRNAILHTNLGVAL